MINPDIRDQAYRFFIEEAAELLQIIEAELLTLRQERSPAKIHEIMRAAHSIKGGAASLELETIRNLAHRLEDFFKALYHEGVELDPELENLLLQGFDCLKEPLKQQIDQGHYDSQAATTRAAPIFAALEVRLGEALQQSADYLPSSVDLGVDMTASIFAVDVPQELERLAAILVQSNGWDVWRELQTTIEMFAGLAELLELPGFASISQAALTALKQSPDRAERIAELAIADWQQAQKQVLAGDRTLGGCPSAELLAFEPASVPLPLPQVNSSPFDEEFRERAYCFFIEEASELLQVIEMGLLSLRSERTPAKIHEIMRAAHSIKGGAASVGLETIRTLAHRLEDYFKALHHESVILDAELETLLLQGFDCLKQPLIQQIDTGTHQPEIALAQAQLWLEIEGRLGDALNQPDAYIPSSADLGVDMVASLFEVDVAQRLDTLASVLAKGSPSELQGELQATLELFEGFAQLLNLPGFNAIGEAVKTALDLNPDRIGPLTELALSNWQQAKAEVLAGDYTVGGRVSPELLNFSVASPSEIASESMVAWADAGILSIEDLGSVFDLDSASILESVPLESVFGSLPQTPELPTAPSDNIFETAIPDLDRSSIDEVFGNAPQSLLNALSLDEVFGSITEAEIAPDVPENPLIEDIFSPPSLDEVFGIIEPINPEQLSAAIEKIVQDFDKLPPLQLPTPVKTDKIEEPIPLRQDSHEPSSNRSTSKTQSTQTPAALSVRVDFNRLERMNNLVGELAINRNSLSLQNEQLQGTVKELLNRFARFGRMTEQLRDLSDQMLIDATRYGSPTVAERQGLVDKSDFDALEMDRYGRLYSSVQGILEEMIQLEESVDDIVLFARGSNQTLETQRQMLTQLRDELMWARMLPLGEVLNRFPRVLRDLSNKYHKLVRLKLTGTGVLVDKMALEKLYDPLLHLLRNAFDHGIELPTIRRQQGKVEEGSIEIRAYHQGNQTIVEVKDDGGGLKYEKILQQALKRELITPEQAAVMSRERISDLIFEPGFSTAEQVSELSGRGVGLDVVRSQLQSLKGTVTVTSNAGQGTIFTLRLPLTLTIAKLLVCLIAPSSTGVMATAVAIPSDSIEEIFVPQLNQIKTSGNQRFLQFAEQLIPIYALGELFEYRYLLPESFVSKTLATTVPTPEDWGLPLLLMRRGQQLCALEVSRLVTEQELVIKPFGSTIASPPYSYGCTILSDGTLLPVINAIILLEQSLELRPSSQETTTLAIDPPTVVPPMPTANPQTPTILVVDDSAALRRTLALTLEKAGYRVLQARDGREALEQLLQNVGIHLVICDVEMPNMNGFEFLGQRRRDAKLLQIPVAMLTSRSSDKHRQLAIHLGANAYFTKPYIEQQFLAAVKDLITQATVPRNSRV